MKPKSHINYGVEYQHSYRAIKSGLEYPRKKNYLTNLNVLLGSARINLPQKVLSNTFFPARKLPTSQSMTRIKHFRVQSSQLKKRKALQHEEFRSTVFSNLKKNYQQKMASSSLRTLSSQKIKRSKSTQLRTTAPIQKQAYQSVKLETPQKRSDFYFYRPSNPIEPQEQNNKQFFLGEDHNRESNGVSNNSDRKVKRQFLRKGSSINKQIVVNLLKIKLIKERQDQQQKKQFENQEILKMIKLYKGQIKADPQGNQSQQRNQVIRTSLMQPDSRMHRLSAWQHEQQVVEFI